MKPSNFLLFLSFIIFLTACHGQKKWTDKGIRKHWLDTTTQVKHDSVRVDTIAINAEVDTFFQEVFRDIHHPCDEQGKLTPETKKKIVNDTKKKLVPEVQKIFIAPLRDILIPGGGNLSIWYDSTSAKLDYKLTLPGQRTICPDITLKEACSKAWWVILAAFFSGILLFIFLVYLNSRVRR